MNFDKQATLTKRLYEKTFDGSLDWKPSVKDSTFQVSFPNYTVRLTEIGRNRANDYVIEIVNDVDEIADAFSDNELRDSGLQPPDGESWYKSMNAMFGRARRISLGADKAIDDILGELE